MFIYFFICNQKVLQHIGENYREKYINNTNKSYQVPSTLIDSRENKYSYLLGLPFLHLQSHHFFKEML